MSFSNWITEGRLVVCVGPGGVGKTTAAAALALLAARRGRRVLVLTIDPARRLASALGLDELGDAEREVWRGAGGALCAAMVDTQSSFDALIRRIARDPEARDRILGNRVYAAFSRTLARSHAYVAMERLYDALHTERYDLVVLDTPPMRSALDILDAPDRLSEFLDESVIGWFVGSTAAGWASRGGAVALRLLSLLASRSLVRELGEFLSLLIHLREGFSSRAAAMRRQLRDPSTRFVLVAAPSPASLAEAEHLVHGLAERDVAMGAVVFNQVGFAPLLDGAARALDAKRLGAALQTAGLEGDLARHVAQDLAAIWFEEATETLGSAGRIRQFLGRLPEAVKVAKLPLLDRDVQDLVGLEELAASFDAR